MSTRELRFTADLPSWWLKPEVPAGAEAAMIGWVMDVHPVDGGVPENVALVLTRALTAQYRLTFPDPNRGRSAQWENHGNYATRFFGPAGILRLHPFAGFSVTTTIDAKAAARLFDTDWSLWFDQRQEAFLSLRERQPPEISSRDLYKFLRSRHLDPGELQSKFGSVGLLTPGPDGDFAQVIFCRPGAMDEFKQSLRAESESVGMRFAEVSRIEFEQTKWFLKEVGA